MAKGTHAGGAGEKPHKGVYGLELCGRGNAQQIDSSLKTKLLVNLHTTIMELGLCGTQINTAGM